MERWIRYRLGPRPEAADAADAEPLMPRAGRGAPAAPRLGALLSSEGLLRVELVAGRLRPAEAEFLRVDARSGDALDVAVYAGSDATFVLARPVQAHSSGLGRLAFVYSVLARSRDAVIYTDATPAILGASERWLALYGLGPEQVLGQNPRIVNSREKPRSTFRAIWRDLTDLNVGSWSGELINRRESGEPVRVWQTITTLRDAEDSVAGYLGVTRDLTQYHEVVERLKASNRELERTNRLQGRLLRDLARQADGDPGDRRDRAARAPALERLYLRSLARTESELLAGLAARRGVRLCWREEGPSLPSLGDKARLSQAIAAILVRALAAAPSGGEVGVTLRQTADGTQEIHVAADGGSAGGASGVGAPAADLEAAQQAVALHGGTLAEERDALGHLRIALRLPLDWSRFSARPWAAVLFDPAEALWPTVADDLRGAGLPVFVAQRPDELRLLCRQELPNLLLLAADAPLPDACRSFVPAAGGAELVPAVCRLRRDPDTGALAIASLEAEPAMTEKIAALFAR